MVLQGLLLLVAATAVERAELIRKELALFEGVWSFESVQNKGKLIAGERLEGQTMAFVGNTWVRTTSDPDVRCGGFRIDPSREPKWLDLVGLSGGEVSLAIYRIEAGKLRICFAPVGSPRPTEFVTKSDSENTIAVHVRQPTDAESVGLQGVWKIVDLSGKIDRSYRGVAIGAGKLLAYGNDDAAALGYRIDSSQAENHFKAIDLMAKDKVYRSLYTVDGDMVSICWSADDRPTDVSGKGDGQTRLLLWRMRTQEEVADTYTGRVRTLTGHTDAVTAVAVCPDGKRAVSASADGTVRIWDIETGRELRRLEGHEGSVLSVACSPDGKHIASAGEDKTVRLWDLQNGTLIRRFTGRRERVNCVAFSPDGRRLLSGDAERSLIFWDIDSGQILRLMDDHQKGVTAVAFFRDGCRAVSAGQDDRVLIWDLREGEVIRQIKSAARCVALSADGKTLFSAGSDRPRLRSADWDLGTVGPSEEGLVLSGALTPDGRYAVWGRSSRGSFTIGVNFHLLPSPTDFTVGGKKPDYSLCTWDKKSWQKRELEGHTDSVLSVAVTPDGRHAVSGSADKTIRIWRLPKERD